MSNEILWVIGFLCSIITGAISFALKRLDNRIDSNVKDLYTEIDKNEMRSQERFSGVNLVLTPVLQSLARIETKLEIFCGDRKNRN